MYFSIIMTVKDAEASVAEAVGSVCNQKHSHWELIVQDGRSEDRTLSILKGFRDPRVKIESCGDAGVYDAMNKAIDRIAGNWVMFLGADDRLFDDTVLSRISEVIESVGEDNALVLLGKASIAGSKIFRSKETGLVLQNSIHHQSAVYHRSLFDGFRFDARHVISGDYDLNCYCLRRARFVHMDIIVSLCGRSGLSSRRMWVGYREEIAVRLKHFGWIGHILVLYTAVRFFVVRLLRWC